MKAERKREREEKRKEELRALYENRAAQKQRKRLELEAQREQQREAAKVLRQQRQREAARANQEKEKTRKQESQQHTGDRILAGRKLQTALAFLDKKFTFKEKESTENKWCRPSKWAIMNQTSVGAAATGSTLQITNPPADPMTDRRPGQRYGHRMNKTSVGIATAVSPYQSEPA